jgi:4-amino-4-deoxy-L-arabinose transferase-like glycosyltransferase
MNGVLTGTGSGKAFVSRSVSVSVLILVLLLQFLGIIDHSLWTPDEPREAEIVREMSISGDYLIPRLAGRPFLEKPPLYYATAIATYKLFGVYFQEAGRFASVLFGVATLLTVYFTTRRIYTDETSDLATLILATFPLFFLASHKMLVDVGLVFFVTAAMCSFILAYKGLFAAGYKVFWLAVACAFLTKGIIGLAIPGAGILIFILWQRDFTALREIRAIQGVLLIAGVMFAWACVLYIKGGYDYLYTFYVYNQFGRFMPMSSIYEGGHIRPFYFYFKDVPAQTLPWSILLIPGFIRAKSFHETERFLCSWLLGGLLILSIASTKREIYFLPMYPAMAMIIACWMSGVLSRESLKWERFFLWGILGLILLVSIALPLGYVEGAGGDWRIAFGVSAVLACAFLFLWKWYRRKLPFLAVMAWSITLILWIPALFPLIDQSKGYKQLFTEFGEIVSHREVTGFKLTETVEALGPFYGDFTVKNIEDREKFIDALKGRKEGYVIVLPSRMDEGLYKELSSRAELVHEGGGAMKREIELWMKHSLPSKDG